MPQILKNHLCNSSSPLEHDFRVQIRQILRFEQQTRRPAPDRAPAVVAVVVVVVMVGELHVIMRQQMHHDGFDLVGGEEAAGAGVTAVAECQAVVITGGVHGGAAAAVAAARRVLRLRRGVGGGRAGGRFAQFLEAEAVESVGVGVEFGIHADGLGGNADGGVGWDDKAVGQLVVLRDDALKGDCWVGGWLAKAHGGSKKKSKTGKGGGGATFCA